MVDPLPDEQPVIQPTQSMPAPVAEPSRAPASSGLNEPQTPTSNAITAAQQDNPSGAAERDIRPNRWQQLGAFIQGASDKSAVGVPGDIMNDPGWLVRKAEREWTELGSNQPKLSAADANKLYPGMPQPFESSIDPGVAKMEFDHYQRQQKNADWAARGGPAPFTEFGVGVGAGFVDPANIALGLATGGLSKLAGVSSSVRNVFLQNLAINAGLSTGGYYAEKDEHLNPSAKEAAIGAVEGAIGGTAFHFAAGSLARLVRSGIDSLRSTPSDIRESNIRTGIAQSEAGSRVDVSAGSVEAAARARGEVEGQTSPMRFTPIQHPSEVLFSGAQNAHGEPVPTSSHELGAGLTLARDGNIANNLAGEHGAVGEFKLSPESKFLDLEQSVHTPESQALLEKISKIEGVKDVGFDPNDTLKDAFDKLGAAASEGGVPPDVMDKVQEAAKEQGYAGYHFQDGEQNGAPPSDRVHLFDEATKPDRVFPANTEQTPAMSTAEKLQRLNDSTSLPENKTSYTPEQAQELHAFRHEASLNSTPDYMDEPTKAAYEQARSYLDEKAKADPELAREIKETLDHEQTIDGQEKKSIESLADCLKGSLG